MKRENLYLVGGALLASTALTSASSAATFTLNTVIATGTTATSTTPRPLSAQVFAATPSASQTLGPAGLIVRFNQSIASKFSMTIGISGAKFKTTAVTSSDVTPVSFLTFSGSGTVNTVGNNATNTLGCAVAVATDKLVLADCQPSLSTAVSIGGFVISGVAFDNATGLATAGGSISLTGDITVSGVAFESTAAQTVVTSRNSMNATVTPNSSITQINVSASPAFSSMVTTGLSVSIATVSVTPNGAVSADLSTSIFGSAAIGSGSAIKLTSTSLTDDAVTKVQATGLTAANSISVTSTQFSGGFVTLASSAGSLQDTFDIRLEFNGTGLIDAASAGTIDVVFASAASTANTGNAIAPPSGSGSTAALSRSGLSKDLNGVQPGTGQGSRTYTSLVRIANTGSSSGTVNIVVRNEATGATLGTYTSPSIPAGASVQVSSANIEAGAGITAVASVLYRLTVSGSINGYVQHVNWNQDAGFFSDLSGSR